MSPFFLGFSEGTAATFDWTLGVFNVRVGHGEFGVGDRQCYA